MPEIDNISINYINTVDNIEFTYVTPLDNIVINMETDLFKPIVSFINELTGEVTLTASAILSLTSSGSGYYNYTFEHNLGYDNLSISIFDINQNLIFADINAENSEYAIIKSIQDITGYKVVGQK